MMFESIKRQLNEIGCTMYELTEVSRTAWEFYFIRHRLDQNRVVTTRTLEAKLYRLSEDGKTLGSSYPGVFDTTVIQDQNGTTKGVSYEGFFGIDQIDLNDD